MELIDRLEAAQEGSRELDAEIGAEARYMSPKSVPHYTTSIDAALTLVPEGSTGFLLNADEPYSQATIFRDGDGAIGQGLGKSPALALCIAALRAKEVRV